MAKVKVRWCFATNRFVIDSKQHRVTTSDGKRVLGYSLDAPAALLPTEPFEIPDRGWVRRVVPTGLPYPNEYRIEVRYTRDGYWRPQNYCTLSPAMQRKIMTAWKRAVIAVNQ